MKQMLLFAFVFFLAILSVAQIQQPYPFRNTDLSIEHRLDDLMGRLSLDEKTDLLLYNSPGIDRLGIEPYNWWNECLHGVARAGKATVFPQTIGMAASFDKELIHRVGTAVSDEARAKHHDARRRRSFTQYTGLTFWTPNINIFRDPRWGRGQETYGEDPYLTAVLASAYVQGLQGDHPDYLKVAACAKHFAVGSGPESIRHHVNAHPPINDYYDTYLPAFKALVDVDVEAVMCAYNRLYDSPCCGSKALLRQLLREEWGFKGHIVSDCWALDDIWLRHKTVASKTEAAVMAAEAGVNVNCGYIYSYLDSAYVAGSITDIQIDELLRPSLRTRFKLGEFDPNSLNPYASLGPQVVNSGKHQKLAYEAALKSMVLLQNKNNCLPLNKDSLHNILVTGPLAADPSLLMGNYNGLSGNFISILEGITQQSAAGMVVTYSPGTTLDSSNRYHGIYLAGSADAVVAVVGYSYLLEGEDGDAMLSDHGGDRKHLRLPENQMELLRQLRKQIPNKPLIVLIGAGGAVNLSEVLDLADAVLMVWYPGEKGGLAAADMLFGNANPSAKLPVSFYTSVDDLPPFDDYDMMGRTYRYYAGDLLFPFGYGLNYSTFSYHQFNVKHSIIETGDPIWVSAEVTNESSIDGEEVVQVYATRMNASEDEPLKTLLGFKRIDVPAWSSRTIQMKLDMEALLQYDEVKNQRLIKPGTYTLALGPDSKDTSLRLQIHITEKP